MKPAGFHLLPLIVAGLLAAEQPPTMAPTRTSIRLGQEIRIALPQYSPPAKTVDQPKPSGPEDDPNVLALPKVTVTDQRPPGHDPDLWFTNLAIQQKALAAYKQSLSDFEWMLNSWHVPLFSPPASARARAAYEDGKYRAEVERLQSLIDQIDTIDPKASAELRFELGVMRQTQDWMKRPAGMGRIK